MILSAPAFDTVLDQLRDCGRYRRECVAFVAEEEGVEHEQEVLHPRHSATPWGYQVDSKWLGEFFASQLSRPLRVVAQVHTHAGAAFHSRTDDLWPIVGTPGFCSIVVARHAQSPVSLSEVYACILQADGSWRQIEAGAVIAR